MKSKVFIFLLFLFTSVLSLGQDANSIRLKNPLRGIYQFDVNDPNFNYGFNYFFTNKTAIEFGVGINGLFGGANFHFIAPPSSNWSVYSGAFINLNLYNSEAETFNFKVPFGLSYHSTNTPFTTSIEVAVRNNFYQTEINTLPSNMELTLKIGGDVTKIFEFVGVVLEVFAQVFASGILY